MDFKVINTTFLGSRIQLTVEKPTTGSTSAGRRPAIAPNFVHSLDAAAMQLTIELASG
jgi:DNA-directed RNA polymerase